MSVAQIEEQVSLLSFEEQLQLLAFIANSVSKKTLKPIMLSLSENRCLER